MARALVFFSLLCAGPSFALPQMMLQDQTHDFGLLYRGQKASHRFTFSNSGTTPLSVLGVHASCGCVEVETGLDRQYMPGEGGEVVVTFDTTHFMGPVVKTLMVLTNESRQPSRLLTIRATVQEELQVVPPIVDFGTVSVGAAVSKQVKLSQLPDVNTSVLEVEYNKETLVVDVTRQDGVGQWLLNVKLTPYVKEGFLQETIFVVTTSKHLAKLPIPVRASIKPAIVSTPDYVEFGVVGANNEASRPLQLRADKSFAVTGLRSELYFNGEPINPMQNVRVSLSATGSQKKKEQSVSLILHNGMPRNGSLNGVVYLQTSDPDAAEVAVKVYAYFSQSL